MAYFDFCRGAVGVFGVLGDGNLGISKIQIDISCMWTIDNLTN
jgi:hypothetical protein